MKILLATPLVLVLTGCPQTHRSTPGNTTPQSGIPTSSKCAEATAKLPPECQAAEAIACSNLEASQWLVPGYDCLKSATNCASAMACAATDSRP